MPFCKLNIIPKRARPLALLLGQNKNIQNQYTNTKFLILISFFILICFAVANPNWSKILLDFKTKKSQLHHHWYHSQYVIQPQDSDLDLDSTWSAHFKFNSMKTSIEMEDSDEEDVEPSEDLEVAHLLSKQDDFANQVSMLKIVIKKAGHECIFLPQVSLWIKSNQNGKFSVLEHGH